MSYDRDEDLLEVVELGDEEIDLSPSDSEDNKNIFRDEYKNEPVILLITGLLLNEEFDRIKDITLMNSNINDDSKVPIVVELEGFRKMVGKVEITLDLILNLVYISKSYKISLLSSEGKEVIMYDREIKDIEKSFEKLVILK